MAQPMLEIKSDKSSISKTTPHILPCRIHYDGPVEPVQSYWAPSQNEDGTKTSYFRGRKLHGKAVQLPAGYRGVVVEKHAPAQPEPGQEVIDLEEEDEQFPLGSLETKAEFEEVVVWGHEVMADEASDPYVRIGEWTRLAEQIHSYAPIEKKP